MIMKKQQSGYYRTKIKIGTDAEGKPVNKWISAKTKRELEEKRREIIAWYIEGTGRAEDELFGPYATRWFQTYKDGTLSESTRRGYLNIINNYLIPAFGDRNLRAIRPTDIQSFINTLAGRNSNTINLSINTLRSIFAAAIRDRVIDSNPAAYIVRPQAKPTKQKPVLTPDQRAALEHTAATHEDGLFLAMLYYTGMRIGEASGLMWDDIDRKSNLIHIRRDIDTSSGHPTIHTVKTASSNRYVPIPAPLRSILDRGPIGLPGNLIFTSKRGNPMSAAAQRQLWARLMLAAGYGHYKPDKPHHACNIVCDFSAHTLRHNFITLCYENGIDAFTAAKLAGHSDTAVTTRIYTHLSKQHLETIKTQVESIFAQSSTKVADQNHK